MEKNLFTTAPTPPTHHPVALASDDVLFRRPLSPLSRSEREAAATAGVGETGEQNSCSITELPPVCFQSRSRKIDEVALPRLSFPDGAVTDEQGCQFLRFAPLHDLVCDNKVLLITHTYYAVTTTRRHLARIWPRGGGGGIPEASFLQRASSLKGSPLYRMPPLYIHTTQGLLPTEGLLPYRGPSLY